MQLFALLDTTEALAVYEPIQNNETPKSAAYGNRNLYAAILRLVATLQSSRLVRYFLELKVYACKVM